MDTSLIRDFNRQQNDHKRSLEKIARNTDEIKRTTDANKRVAEEIRNGLRDVPRKVEDIKRDVSREMEAIRKIYREQQNVVNSVSTLVERNQSNTQQHIATTQANIDSQLNNIRNNIRSDLSQVEDRNRRTADDLRQSQNMLYNAMTTERVQDTVRRVNEVQKQCIDVGANVDACKDQYMGLVMKAKKDYMNLISKCESEYSQLIRDTEKDYFDQVAHAKDRLASEQGLTASTNLLMSEFENIKGIVSANHSNMAYKEEQIEQSSNNILSIVAGNAQQFEVLHKRLDNIESTQTMTLRVAVFTCILVLGLLLFAILTYEDVF